MKINRVSVFLLALSLTFSYCSDGTSESAKTAELAETTGDSLLRYSVYKDELSDEPWGAQVKREFILKDKVVKEEELRKLLAALYMKAKSSTKSQYFEHPTSVYIFVYTTKDKAEAGNGQWIGRVSQNNEDGNEPEIVISEKQLKLTTVVEEGKFGFSEKERQRIYKEITKIELQTIDKEDLRPKYLEELAKKLNTTVAIMDSIETEGFSKGWTVHGI